MANVTIKFYSLWSLYLDKKSINLKASTVDEAMEKLETLFGEQLREKLRTKNLPFTNLRDSSTVLVNGVSLRNFKTRRLEDGDQLQIFPPVAGG